MHTSLVKTAEKQQSQSLFANVISVSLRDEMKNEISVSLTLVVLIVKFE